MVKIQVNLILVLIIVMCSAKNCIAQDVSCPPWYVPRHDGKCSFSHTLPEVICKYGNTSGLQIGFCITVTNSSTVVSQCPYIVNTNNFSQFQSTFQVLPKQLNEVNKTFCSVFNRDDFLCSKCIKGYGLAAYQYYGLMCVKCSSSVGNWIAYILLIFIPPTILFVLSLFLSINVHCGCLTGFIYFSHLLIMSIYFYPGMIILSQQYYGYWPTQVFLALYGVWSLDFLQFLIPPFCVSTHLTELQLISLGYVSSVYPLALCIITYYLIELHVRGDRILAKVCRPFYKCFNKLKFPSNTKSSVINTFATFLLLSYSKNLFVSVTLIQGYTLFSLDIHTNTLTSLSSRSVDLGAHYFGSTHAPYGALGILGCFLTVILPLVLVLLYPTRLFPKLIQCCGLRRWHAIRTFMEVFVGTYKDGTGGENNKRDYRFVASLYLIGRILVAATWAKSGFMAWYAWLIVAVPFVVAAICFAFFKPHRKRLHNVIDILLFLLTTKMCIFLHLVFETGISQHTLRVLILILLIDFYIPHIFFIIYFGYKLVSWLVSYNQNNLNELQLISDVEDKQLDDHNETKPLLATHLSS